MSIYTDMLNAIPTGSFYNVDPSILPFSDKPYQLTIGTGVPNALYGIQLNLHPAGTVTTDGSGNANIVVQLILGDNIITLTNAQNGQQINAYFTTRNWATLLAAISDVFTQFDDQATELYDDSNLATANLDLIDQIWGRRLRNNNSLVYPLDAYREILQILEQAYRQYGSRVGGLMESCAAFTHIHPLVYSRDFGPTWYLGNQFVKDPTFDKFTYIPNPMPDDWWIASAGGPITPTTVAGVINPSSLRVGAGVGVLWSLWGKTQPEILNYKGFFTTLTAFVGAANFRIGISFDGGVTFTTAAGPTQMVDENSVPISLWRLSLTILIPVDATDVVVEVFNLFGGGLTIEKVDLSVGVHSALYLGHNTTPRTQSRSKRGYFCYLWSPQAFSDAEKSLIGLPESAIVAGAKGHIDTISSAQSNIDRFDVNEFSGPTLLNVKGVTDLPGLLAGTATNMVAVQRTPLRFSFMRPTRASAVVGEVVNPIGAGPATIALSTQINPDLSRVILYENGVPVTHDHITITGPSQLTIDFGPIPGVKYTVDYDALIRWESAAIDANIATVANYTWFADVFHLLTLDFTAKSVPTITGIQFDSSYRASLLERSDQDQSTSTLIADNGVTRTEVPISDWLYADANTIKISPTVFDNGSLYYISYNARVAHPTPRPTATIEFRQASSLIGLAAATYAPININQVVQPLQYCQYRITYDNVLNTGDVRLYSALVKGLNTSITGTIPILQDPIWVP